MQRLHTEKSYDMQVSQLTRSVATLEENLHLAEDEKHGLLQDLAAIRDLCARLESTKDALQRQLTAKSLDHEKVHVVIINGELFLYVLASILTASK